MTFNGYVQKQSREGQPWLQDRNFFRFTSLYVDLLSIQSVSTVDYYLILKNFDKNVGRSKIVVLFLLSDCGDKRSTLRFWWTFPFFGYFRKSLH